MKEMLIFVTIAFFAVVVLWVIYTKLTHKRLAKHQEEWNIIKLRLKVLGASQNEIYEAYEKYIDKLSFDHQDCIGACYPHI